MKVQAYPTKAPFAYMGNKVKIAAEVWRRLGQVQIYIEPFCGSCATLLNRPRPFKGVEIINDRDCFVANFWRATTLVPEEVAKHADWPINATDLSARSISLVYDTDFRRRMLSDPNYYDARIAGWWLWGKAMSFQHWVDKKTEFPNKNINPSGIHSVEDKYAAMEALRRRMRNVWVLCGDWQVALGEWYAHTTKTCGVFLDPPYLGEEDSYLERGGPVANAVGEWAAANGEKKYLRIAMCGYDGDYKMPKSWIKLRWKAKGGGVEAGAQERAAKECVWFSPHCLKVEE